MNYLTDNVSLFALIVERREPGFVAGVLCVELASEFTLVFLNFFFPSFRFLTYSLKKKILLGFWKVCYAFLEQGEVKVNK